MQEQEGLLCAVEEHQPISRTGIGSFVRGTYTGVAGHWGTALPKKRREKDDCDKFGTCLL